LQAHHLALLGLPVVLVLLLDRLQPRLHLLHVALVVHLLEKEPEQCQPRSDYQEDDRQ
jgi:hypothetical protein